MANATMKSRQRGISFLGLVFVGGVLAMTGVIAAQVFPTFVEYQAIDKAAKRRQRAPTVPEVRSHLRSGDRGRQHHVHQGQGSGGHQG
jgi:hypothetical protein